MTVLFAGAPSDLPRWTRRYCALVGLTLTEAIERFRSHAGDTEAARIYLSLLEGAQARWESAVQVDYRRRDGDPIVVFSLGPADTMNAAPAVAGDFLERVRPARIIFLNRHDRAWPGHPRKRRGSPGQRRG